MLVVNRAKSQAAPLKACAFLGFQIGVRGRAVWSGKAHARFKQRVREIARRNRGHRVQDVIFELRRCHGLAQLLPPQRHLLGVAGVGRMGPSKSAAVLLEAMGTAPDAPPPSARLGHSAQGSAYGHAQP